MPELLLRAYSPLGHYPSSGFVHPDASLIISDGLIFSAFYSEGISFEGYYADREWIDPYEVKLLAALALSATEGNVYFYPYHLNYKKISHPYSYDLMYDDDLRHLRRSLVEMLHERKQRRKSFWWHPAPDPPAFGGREYSFNPEVDSSKEPRERFEKIDPEDPLLVRGLEALLKGHLLHSQNIFHTEACISLHISMEASMHIIFRRLKPENPNPSNEDAAEYIAEAFDDSYVPEGYFNDYYRDRIKAVHPANKFGTFPHAPLSADDFYHLYDSLRAVYDFLLTGRIDESE
jgi:hypothetical protein